MANEWRDETLIVFTQFIVGTRVLPASANVSFPARVDNIDLVLLTLAKRELCSELTRSFSVIGQVRLSGRV